MSDPHAQIEQHIKSILDLMPDDEDIVILYSGKDYDFIRHTNNADLRDAENRLHRYIDDISHGYS